MLGMEQDVAGAWQDCDFDSHFTSTLLTLPTSAALHSPGEASVVPRVKLEQPARCDCYFYDWLLERNLSVLARPTWQRAGTLMI